MLPSLVLAGWPLINGDVVTNTEYNGSALLPASPPSHGVQIPAYYYSARSWLQTNYPGSTKLILPMPDTWLSADSWTTWGYEGGSTIYEDLLPGPILMNDQGPLGILQDNALQDVFTMAASGGAPDYPKTIPLNGTVTLWPGYTGDYVSYIHSSPGTTSPRIVWGVNSSIDWGSNGHQFTLSTPIPPVNNRYLAMDVAVSDPGTFEVTWGVANGTELGWYSWNLNAVNASSLWIPTSIPPALNYDPSRLNVSSFSQADELVFQFHPDQPSTSEIPTVTISNITSYDSDPESFNYYASSLGARLIVTDSSIEASSNNPLQNYTNLGPITSALSGALLANFGRLSIYSVNDSLPLLGCASSWSDATWYWTALATRTSQSGYFLVNPPSWLKPGSADCTLTDLTVSANQYSATVTAGGTAILAFLQNADPGWVLTVDGQVVGSQLLVNGFASGWVLNLTGPHRIQLTFLPETVLIVSLAVSLVVSTFLLFLSTFRGPTKRLLQTVLKKLRRRSSPSRAKGILVEIN